MTVDPLELMTRTQLKDAARHLRCTLSRMHGLLEATALSLKNALPVPSKDESIAVRQDRTFAHDAIRAADNLLDFVAHLNPDGHPRTHAE